MMDEIKKLTVATAMRKMFKDGRFNICTVDNCLVLAGHARGAGGDSYKVLSALHCVDFSDMPAELGAKIPALIADCFSGMSLDDLMRASEPASANNGGHALSRLI